MLPQEPGWFRAPTGGLYEVVLTARSGEQVLAGVEVAALPERFVPLTEAAVNSDLWEFLRWVLERAANPGRSTPSVSWPRSTGSRKANKQADI